MRPGVALGAQRATAFGVIEPRRMDRRLAQRNLTAGLLAGGIAVLAFGLAFFFAVLYITQ